MDNEAFSYTYSAKQQEEVDSILQKYIPQTESPIEQLRRLDKRAEQTGNIASVALGVTGTMLLGVGMCCTLEWTDYFILGIFIGLAGIALIAAAYPIYKTVTKKRREKIAPQIIELSKKIQP